MKISRQVQVITLILGLIFGSEISYAQLPKAPNCVPNTLNNCCTAGIHRMRLNSIDNDNPGKNGNVGYEDLTATHKTNLTLGTTYLMEVWTNQLVEENVRAWIDFNNDGDFDTINELIFKSDTVLEYHSQLITIPGSAVQDTALRLRVSSDFLGVHVNPCRDLHVGQAEDYTVMLVSGFQAPIAAFTADETLSCDGIVQFKDLSSNAPVKWFWDFGDGKVENFQHPQHVYSSSGTYNVSLTVENAQGVNDTIYSNYITVKLGNSPVDPNCRPGTQSNACLGYGIFNVRLNDINHSSGCGKEGYRDFSCEAQTNLLEGKTYTLYISTNTNLAQDTKVWLDLNSDGDFEDERELVLESYNVLGQVQGDIKIPANTTTIGSIIRMRVMSDIVGNGTGMISCFPPEFGQVEDYGIIVEENTNPPIANFFSSDTYTCTGAVQFYEDVENVPSSYLWDFGDGTTSNLRDPLHYYLLQNDYTVTLEASNDYGSETKQKNFYIKVDTNCEYNMPFGGNAISHECSGKLFDYGGPFNSYSPLSTGKFIIEPYNADQITITIKSLNIETSNDYIRIWEGDINDNIAITPPIFGTNPPAPIIVPSGKATIEFFSNEMVEGSGFELEWSCQGKPYANMVWDPSRSDLCEGKYQFINLSSRASSYEWTFNKGDASNDEHPVFYMTDSNKAEWIDVELAVENAMGHDTSYVFDLPVHKLFPDFESHSVGNMVVFTDLTEYDADSWTWYFGDGDSSLIQSPSHLFSNSGNHQVELVVSNQHCSNKISKSPTGVKDVSQIFDNQLFISPNPCTNNFTFLLKNKKIQYISVLNSVGKSVISRDLTNSVSNTINIEHLESGLYIVIARAGNEILTQKLMVTNNK